MNTKRLLAALLAAVMLLGCAACGGNSASASEEAVIDDPCYAKIGDKELPASVYKLFLLDGFNSVANAYELDYKKILKADIDGVTGEAYINDYADKQFARYYAISKAYIEGGLEASDNDTIQAAYYATYANQNNSDLYTTLGIPVDGLTESYLMDARANAIFRSVYGKGGSKAIPQSDKEAAMSDKYYRVQYISVDTSDVDDSGEGARSDFNTYLSRYNAGEKFEDIIYQLDQEQKTAEAAANASVFVEQAERSEDYKYDYYFSKTDSGYPNMLMAEIDKMANESAKIIEADGSIYLVRKLDVNGSDNPVWEETALNCFIEDKREEFTAYIDSLTEGLEIEYNGNAKSEYTAASFYKLLKKYIFDAQLNQLNG